VAGGEILVFALLAAWIGLAIYAARDLRDAFAKPYGEVIELPAEAKVSRPAIISEGGGSGSNTDRLGTLQGGTRTSRPGEAQ
jgi:hypothetical protein